jgi:hypothetical protein
MELPSLLPTLFCPKSATEPRTFNQLSRRIFSVMLHTVARSLTTILALSQT